MGSVVVALASYFVVLSCRGADAVREWTPADHDQPPAAQQAPAPEQPASQPNLADVTWNANCQRCHGPEGAGDGPEAAMVRAPNLTREDWQARTSDADIATTIRRGRGKMPAFELPPSLIATLVQRIRAHRDAR
jgi:cytochrome c oxidase cbb3-type subunit 3